MSRRVGVYGTQVLASIPDPFLSPEKHDIPAMVWLDGEKLPKSLEDGGEPMAITIHVDRSEQWRGTGIPTKLSGIA